MNCPKCGASCPDALSRCPQCGALLASASYRELGKEEGEKNRPKKRRKRHVFLILLLILILLGLAGYFIYLKVVGSTCTKVTDQIFTAAKEMDLSSFDKEDLPASLNGETDLKKYMTQRLKEAVAASELGSVIDTDTADIDWDGICEDLAEDASWEITDVETTWNRCHVKVHLKNRDFSSLPDAVYDEFTTQIQDSNSNLWSRIKESFWSLFSGSEKSDEEEESLSEKIYDLVKEIYEGSLDNLPDTEYDGEIVYGIRDGRWTLLSMDEQMFYHFYGVAGLIGEE